MEPVHQIIERRAECVALSRMHATRYRPVEPQSGQMSSDGGVDDVGRRVVLAGDVEHRRNIDTRGVRFSHITYDVAETRRVPPGFSVVR